MDSEIGTEAETERPKREMVVRGAGGDTSGYGVAVGSIAAAPAACTLDMFGPCGTTFGDGDGEMA